MTDSTHEYRAYLIGTPDVELSIKGGRIRLDSGGAPHVTATLDVTAGAWTAVLTAYPSDSGYGFGEQAFGGGGFGGYYNATEWSSGIETLANLDPRDNARIRIDVTALFPSGVQSRSFNLGLRSRPVQHADATVTLDLASDEALLEDWGPLADDDAPLALAGSLRDVIDYVLDTVIPGTALEATPANDADLTPAPGGSEEEAFTWRAGQSAMEFLTPLFQVAGYRLVCDEERKWTLRSEGYFADGSTTIRHGVNMLDADETIDRASGIWYDAAVARYTWTDSAGNEKVRVDSHALATPYTRLRLFEFRDTPFPGYGFAEYAVRRAQQRGREVRALSVSDWRTNAEQPATIILPDAPTQTGLLDSVEYDLDRDEMTVTARTLDTPDSAWVLIPEDETWLDQPLGESWTEEVI